MPRTANSVSMASTTIRIMPRRRSPGRLRVARRMVNLRRIMDRTSPSHPCTLVGRRCPAVASLPAGWRSGRRKPLQVLDDAGLPALLRPGVPDADGDLDGPDANPVFPGLVV